MSDSLRVVAFTVMPMANNLVSDWAAQRGHRLSLVVTSPSPRGERYGQGHRELVAGLPPTQDVLVTSRMRRTAAPVIAALAPDLILSATFPHRIPPEVTAIPRFGALNLHPAPLPRGRGPTPQRLIYEGDQTASATLHRIVPAFDAGAILSRRTRPLPEDLTSEHLVKTWMELMVEALDEGVARAVAGSEGEPQDEAQATYATPFTEEERWLCWEEPALTIQRRAAALNVPVPMARAMLDGQPARIAAVRAHPGPAPAVQPGAILHREGETTVVRVADGTVSVTGYPLFAQPG